MKNIDVSFITINYNSSNLTLKLVESIILNTVDLNFEVIIIDNSSEYKFLKFSKLKQGGFKFWSCCRKTAVENIKNL